MEANKIPPSDSLSRRRFLELLGLGVPVTAALAACSSSGPSQAGAGGGGGNGGGGGKGSATYWFLSGQPQQKIREDAVKAFNASSKTGQINYTEFQNDAYKTKIKTAIGAGQAPTIIWGWGGGGLRSYVQDNKVEDLTDWFSQNADVKNRLFASSFGAATVNDKIYAMPCETVQPIILFWNKKVFDDVGRRAAEDVGRHPGPRSEVQGEEHRADLARRPVALDEHDVARVPVRPHRRPRRVRRGVQRREERVVEPRLDQGAHRDARS